MDGWIDRWMEGYSWMDGWMEGYSWMDRWMDSVENICLLLLLLLEQSHVGLKQNSKVLGHKTRNN